MDEADEWISAKDALARAKEAVGHLDSSRTICKRARLGLVRARAKHYSVDGLRKTNVELPPDFWWAEGEAALEQNWQAGDFATWLKDHIRMQAFGVSFCRQDIEEFAGVNAGPSPVLQAYEKLDLHPQISAAADQLYKNGHYANAIEEAVKALNALVRQRSGSDEDGMSLMKHVFSPKMPVLRFNSLADRTDQDEQEGFMMMFAGAIAGLRNPRAHRLIKDDPERALEFIAYVSLLAKLLDGAKKA